MLASIRVRQTYTESYFARISPPGCRLRSILCLLRQVVANLLDNAVNACGESGGVVDISLRASGDEATIIFGQRVRHKSRDTRQISRRFIRRARQAPAWDFLWRPV